MAKPRLVHSRSRRYCRKRGPDFGAILVPAATAAIGILALAWINGGPDPSQAVSPLSIATAPRITVIDGDTIRVRGATQSVRLVGYNAPESHEPRCANEARLGERAKRRLGELIASGDADLAYMRCACPPGTEGTSKCNYGRACGTLLIDGRDVAGILIGEGLAVPFICGGGGLPADAAALVRVTLRSARNDE